MSRDRGAIRRAYVVRACPPALVAVMLAASASCHSDNDLTSPNSTAAGRPGPPPRLSSGSGENPDSLPPGSFEIFLFVDDITTGIFSKREFASYTERTLVRFTASQELEKVHRKSSNKVYISPRGQYVGGGCYSYIVVDFRKASNQFGGGWTGQCNSAPLSADLVLEGTGTARRVAGYPWNGFEQCGGLGQPTCYEYGAGHKVELRPTAQKLELVVDSSTVTSGSTVRFTARRTDGGAFTVLSWTWKPLTPAPPPGASSAVYGPSSSGCGNTAICDAVLRNVQYAAVPAAVQRGYMYVRALVNGVAETARTEVQVRPISADLTLTGDRMVIGEGDTVVFTGAIAPSTVNGVVVPYEVVGWSWTQDGTVVMASVAGPDSLVPLRGKAAHNVTGASRSGGTVSLASESEPDTVLAVADEEYTPPDDRPPTIPCEHTALGCTMAINASGTASLTAYVAGTLATRSVHVTVEYLCPPSFYREERAYITETYQIPGQVSRGPRTVWVGGALSYIEKVGQNGDFPQARYRPWSGHDEDGRILVPELSWMLWECHMFMRTNRSTGEQYLAGEMHYLRKMSVHFIKPAAP